MKGVLSLLLISCVLLSACSTTQTPVLSDSMTFTPGWSTLKLSAKKAASSPVVWGNLLVATLLQIGNLDRQLSDQLREHTPLFGSGENAAKRSDDLLDLSTFAYVSSALLVPGPEDPAAWLSAKTKLIGAQWLTVKTARSLTSGIKSLADRERPNGQNDRSFPSGHATATSTQTQMASLNIEYLALETDTRKILNNSLDGLTALTAWARVEAGMHYPSDVLSGWALGYFIAQIANTFIAPDSKTIVIPQAVYEGAGIQLVILF